MTTLKQIQQRLRRTRRALQEARAEHARLVAATAAAAEAVAAGEARLALQVGEEAAYRRELAARGTPKPPTGASVRPVQAFWPPGAATGSPGAAQTAPRGRGRLARCEVCGAEFPLRPARDTSGRWCGQGCYEAGTNVEARRRETLLAVRDAAPVFLHALVKRLGYTTSTVNNDVQTLKGRGFVVKDTNGWRCTVEGLRELLAPVAVPVPQTAATAATVGTWRCAKCTRPFRQRHAADWYCERCQQRPVADEPPELELVMDGNDVSSRGGGSALSGAI